MSVFVDIEKKLGDFSLKVCFSAGDETLALLGASGCGKSMTLKCIAGVAKPDRGRIIVDGETLFDSEKGIDLSPQERRVGLMFQSYALFPNMTVLQNISTGARRERDKQKRETAVKNVMESFGLTALSSHYPHQLSGGQQQRVALARILVSDPRILLLDEPFSALDSHLRFRLEQELRDVIKYFGKSVLLVSHDRDEVYRMADSIAVMNNGTIEVFGEKRAVFLSPKTRTGAVLTGCKNISAVKKLQDGRIYAEDWGIYLSADVPDKIAFVGVRMHDLRLGSGENSFRCKVTEVIENPFSVTLMLRPLGVESKVSIGWETGRKTWQKLMSDELEVCIPNDALLLLEGDKIC